MTTPCIARQEWRAIDLIVLGARSVGTLSAESTQLYGLCADFNRWILIGFGVLQSVLILSLWGAMVRMVASVGLQGGIPPCARSDD